LEKLNQDIELWHKSTKVSSRMQGKVTIDRLRTDGQWPKLKCKGSATRQLAAYALRLISIHSDGTEGDRLIIALCQMLVRFYNILDSQSQFLDPAAKAEIPTLGQKFAEVYTRLSKQALIDGLRLWKMHPKLHLWEHLTEHQAIQFGNPRYYWCYADEDLVGRMVEVARSVHPKTLAISVIFKWLHTSFES